MSVEIITGPPVSGPQGMSKEAAEQALLRNAEFPKGADYKLQALAGRWIAAVSTPDFVKEAEFPPSDDGSDSGSDGPPSDGPDDSGSDDGSSSDDGGSSDGGSPAGPPHHDKGKGEGGDKGGLHGLEAKIDLLLSALGIDPSGGADPMAGGDPMGGPGPAGPPPPHPGAGHAGPPPPPPGQMAGGRPIKPGETPPGAVPGGPPTFSSVDPSHPWAHLVGKQAAFTVREHLGAQEDITAVHDELQSIARSGGFRVARFTPFHDENGNRNVEAVIQTPQLA